MNIMICGESTSRPTGFGKQTRLIAEGLCERGHEVTVLGTFPVNSTEKPFAEYPVPFLCKKSIDKHFRRIKPDIVLFFGYMGHLAHFVDFPQLQANAPCVYYPAWEGTSPPPWRETFNKLPYVVHLTKFSTELWGNPGDHQIPHAAEVIHNFQDRTTCRGHINRLFHTNFGNDDFLILNVDRNSFRKRWDLCFDYLKRVSDSLEGRVTLIAHTSKEELKTGGYDLEKLAESYGVKNQVFFTPFTWDSGLSEPDMAYLYKACDLRVTFSMGEGFGQPSDEAAIAGIPQIAPRHSSLQEIMSPEFLYDCDCVCSDSSNILWSMPSVTSAVEKTRELFSDKDMLNARLQNAQTYPNRVVDVAERWEKYLTAVLENHGDSWKHIHGYVGQGRENDRRLLFDLLSKYFYNGGLVLDIGSAKPDITNYLISRGINTEHLPPDFCNDNYTGHYEVGIAVDSLQSLMVEASPLARCKWVITAFRAPAKLDGSPLTEVEGHTLLTVMGLTRRGDIEKMIGKELGIELEYQIYQNSADMSIFPKGLKK